MITFQNNSIAMLQVMDHMRCGMTQVSQNCQFFPAFLTGELQRFSGIVRHCKGHDFKVTKTDDFRVVRDSQQALQIGRQNGFICALAHPHGYAALQGQRCGATDMVAVLVGNKNGVNVTWSQVGVSQPVCQLFLPKSAINKQPHWLVARRLNDCRIACATAPQIFKAQPAALLQVVRDDLNDALGIGRGFRNALRIQNRNQRGFALALDGNTVLKRRRRRCRAAEKF